MFLEISFDCYEEKNMKKTLNYQLHEYPDAKNCNKLKKQASMRKYKQHETIQLLERARLVKGKRGGGAAADSSQTYE